MTPAEAYKNLNNGTRVRIEKKGYFKTDDDYVDVAEGTIDKQGNYLFFKDLNKKTIRDLDYITLWCTDGEEQGFVITQLTKPLNIEEAFNKLKDGTRVCVRCPGYFKNGDVLVNKAEGIIKKEKTKLGDSRLRINELNIETIYGDNWVSLSIDNRYYDFDDWEITPIEDIQTSSQSSGCPHTQTKQVPLGIGGPVEIITVCCLCKEEVV